MSKRTKRTEALLERLRGIYKESGMTADHFREDLNSNYLHPEYRVSPSTVSNWLYGDKPRTSSGTMNSENALAILEWCEHQEKTTKR